MPDFEVDVTVSFDTQVIVRDCTDGFEFGEAEELVMDNVWKYAEDAWLSIEAYQSLEIEKGESNGNTS
tara:strand:- start:42 stop:245 length:204 start_codon:yes stop_codon:yes gene_type:complete